MIHKKEIVSVEKGLNTNLHPSEQPKGTYTYALNQVKESIEGSFDGLSNEEGNSACYDLSSLNSTYSTTFHPIGHINMTNDEVVVFLATEDSSYSSIIIINANCNITEVVTVACLNFNIHNQIKGTWRLHRGCDRVIYFVDDLNPDRSINLDDIINNPLTHSYLDSNGTFDCTLTSLNPNNDWLCMDVKSVNDTGGTLRLGAYEFIAEYLDSSLNEIGYQITTHPIHIISGNQTSDHYEQLEGGNPATEPATTKSITLEFGNVDTRFEYIRLAVAETIDGVTTIYRVADIPITSTTHQYTYRGTNTNSSVQITNDDINLKQLTYSSRTIEQHDNRLLRANTKEVSRDYASFQQAANSIQVEYITKPFVAEQKHTTDNGWSPKSPLYTQDTRSYMRDEVYALGIVWLFKDGSCSPAFHIPGREAETAVSSVNLFNQGNTQSYSLVPGTPLAYHNRPQATTIWDRDIYDFSNIPSLPLGISDKDVEHLGSPTTIERWKVVNTAVRTDIDSTLSNGHYTKGELSFWESELDYPDDTDCNGDRVYPTGKIRHHRMPDTTLEPHFLSGTDNGIANPFSTEQILPLGLNFSNINIPSGYEDEVQGYMIVRSIRSNDNKTVLDKGIVYRNIQVGVDTDCAGGNNTSIWRQSYPYNNDRDSQDGSTPDNYLVPANLVLSGYFDSSCECGMSINEDDNFFSFHGPLVKFRKNFLNATHIKMELNMQGNAVVFNYDLANRDYLSTCKYKHLSRANPTELNRKIEKQAYVDANEFLPGFFSEDFSNQDQQEAYLIDLESPLLGSTSLSFLPNSDNTGSNETSLNALYSHVRYISVNVVNPSMYGNLHDITYYPASNCLITPTQTTVNEVYGGDIFISQLSFRKTLRGVNCEFSDPDTDNHWDERNIITFFTESEINAELRHEGDLTADTSLSENEQCIEGYYPKTWNNTLGTTRKFLDKVTTCANYYAYNEDYSKERNLKPFFPLSSTYDYCTSCRDEYPHRILYSQKSYQEQLQDNFRITLPNNYRNIPTHSGEIADMFVKSDQLYVKSLESLWGIATKPQTLNTNEDVITIGTGEFFEIPPKEIVHSKTSYAGSQTRWETIVNEYGATIVDAKSGKVFLLTDTLKEISSEGIRNFFEENLPFELLKVYPDYAFTDNTTSRIGIGLMAVYDKRYRRFILHKRDYKPIDSSVVLFQPTAENNYSWTIDVGGEQILVSDPYSRPDLFENTSWTVSYNYMTNTWVSFHSYLPNYMYSTQSEWYSSILDNTNIWKHNVLNYQNFYGTTYPSILETVVSKTPLESSLTNDIHYFSNVMEYDSTLKHFRDIRYDTYDKILFYNDWQSSGELDVVIKNNNDPFSIINFNTNEIYIDRNEREWSVSRMRDMVVQTNPEQPLHTSDWSTTTYQNQYPIDKVPNANVINFLKSQFESQKFRDKYLKVRCTYSNPNNRRMLTKYFISNNSDSNR